MQVTVHDVRDRQSQLPGLRALNAYATVRLASVRVCAGQTNAQPLHPKLKCGPFERSPPVKSHFVARGHYPASGTEPTLPWFGAKYREILARAGALGQLVVEACVRSAPNLAQSNLIEDPHHPEGSQNAQGFEPPGPKPGGSNTQVHGSPTFVPDAVVVGRADEKRKFYRCVMQSMPV